MSLLSDILSSRVRAEVFRLLFGLEQDELHLREMERRSSLNVATVRQDLKKLAKLGLVKSRRDGNRLYYSANWSHPLYQDIHNLVLKTAALVEVLYRAIGKKGVRVAFVFGSVAKGTPGAESDVDLMVIGELGLRELSRRLGRASEDLGREVNPHVFGPKEFVRRRKAEEHFLSNVMASPKIFIVGTEDDLRTMA